MRFTNRVETLLKKTQVSKTVYHIEYTIDPELEWKPGQYVGIQTSPTHRRAYSILDCKDGVIHFLIDVNPGGIASKFFESAIEGNQSLIIGPYGRFFPRENDNEMILIATGTGLVPFISWFRDFQKKTIHKKFTLIFGCRSFEDEIAYKYFEQFLSDESKLIHCISREEKISDYENRFKNTIFFSGRVTKYLDLNFELSENYDYYICGNDDMVNDCTEILSSKGIHNIFVEKYG